VKRVDRRASRLKGSVCSVTSVVDVFGG